MDLNPLRGNLIGVAQPMPDTVTRAVAEWSLAKAGAVAVSHVTMVR